MRELYYISATDGVVAIIERKNTVNSVYYVHKDHLGSYDVITSQDGTVKQRNSFDPWGRRRNPANWTYDNVPTDYYFDRGFTAHEHLDQFGLINMNGRAYDPLMAMFLSPDNFIQAPDLTQNYNRYAYCFYNPLKYLDPTGMEAEFGVAEKDKPWWKFRHRNRDTDGRSGWDEFWTNVINLWNNTESIGVWNSSSNNYTYSDYSVAGFQGFDFAYLLPEVVVTAKAPRRDMNTTSNDNNISDDTYDEDLFTYHNIIKVPLLPPITNYVTRSTIGKGNIHLEIVNGSQPSQVLYAKLGPFTGKVSSSSVSFKTNVGYSYVTFYAGTRTFGIEFGYSKDGFSGGFQSDIPSWILTPLVIEFVPSLSIIKRIPYPAYPKPYPITIH